MAFVYKVVPAPRRAKKMRGAKTPAEALAMAFEAVMAEQAQAGWEYLRCDLAPMEVKSGLFGRATETHQALMVFRRPAQGQVAGQGAAPGARVEPEIPRLGAARLE
ncbi:MAG: hypothetical protein ACFCUS_13255 [Rubrimonas sp.]|uniref:hypothetical protein n=1 Tax=Rubrimonas sp. TaxID=2036015 RepID=UPI002FDD9C7A